MHELRKHENEAMTDMRKVASEILRIYMADEYDQGLFLSYVVPMDYLTGMAHAHGLTAAHALAASNSVGLKHRSDWVTAEMEASSEELWLSEWREELEGQITLAKERDHQP